MQKSDSIKEIASAIGNFQKEMTPIDRDAEANYGRYATLGNILKHIKKPMIDNGLSFSQLIDGDSITTVIMHSSGEWVSSTGNMKLEKQTAQGQGSAITYARRYHLSAALGLDTDEDDDGAAAETQKPAQKVAAKPVEKDAELKARIKTHLVELGYKDTEMMTIGAVSQLVAKEVNKDMSMDTLTEIVRALADKVAKK